MTKLNKEHFLISQRTSSTLNNHFHHEKCSKTLKKAYIEGKNSTYYWPICGHFQVLKWPILADFCRYFGQFLIFISGNPAENGQQ